MAKESSLPPGLAPRLLSRAAAAEYCGISVNHFDAHVDVAPRLVGAKKLWDRKRLDAWIDGAGDFAMQSSEDWLGKL